MNIEDMEGLDEETRKKIEELQKVTLEKDGVELFVAAQVTFGKLLFDNGFNSRAIKAYSNIQRSYDSNLYAATQYTIGEILESEGETKKALKYLKNIEHSDDPKIYAAAQYYIGFILSESSDIKGAVSIWSAIKRSDSIKAYIESQFDIGFYLKESGDIEGAISAWRNIDRLDDPELYSQAQFNIGSNLLKINKIEEALTVWRNIDKFGNPEAYAKAQLRIGSTLTERGDYQGGLLAWCNVDRKDNLEAYAKAQFKVASFLIDFEYIQAAIVELQLIKLIDDAEAYAKAQFNIGFLLEKNNDVEGALKAFRNIKRDNDIEAYGKAQYAIGGILISYSPLKDYSAAKTSFELAREMFPYEAQCYIKICEILNFLETESFGLSSLRLLNTVLSIVGILTLDFNKYDNEEKPFERKLAHYTSTYTSNLLIGDNKTKRSPSFFRLNTINNVNDPSEGQLLVRKLKGIKSNEFYPLDFNERFHAFISCFTFNHDSLNQFRLYGKENDKEASGMSLVFRKDFFKSKNFIGGISHLSIGGDRSENISDSNKNNVNLHSVKIEDGERSKEVLKRSVMRCVYLDPTSEYFHLAQRNRLTFYREFGDKVIIINGNKRSQAEYEWELYEKYIGNITSKFKKAYDTFKFIYKEVEQETNNIRVNFDVSKAKELSEFTD
jgi:TPR repeat protein